MAAARALFLHHGKFCMRYGGQVQPRQPWHSQNGAPGAALAISQRVARPWERKMCTTGGFYTGECSKCARAPSARAPSARAPRNSRAALLYFNKRTPGACSSALKNSVQQTAPEACRDCYSSCPRIQPQGWVLGVGATPYWASLEGPPEGKRAAANWRERENVGGPRPIALPAIPAAGAETPWEGLTTLESGLSHAVARPGRGTACMSMPLAMPVMRVYCSVRNTPSGPPICRARATPVSVTRLLHTLARTG